MLSITNKFHYVDLVSPCLPGIILMLIYSTGPSLGKMVLCVNRTLASSPIRKE
jgi:hypothetical protein